MIHKVNQILKVVRLHMFLVVFGMEDLGIIKKEDSKQVTYIKEFKI